MKKQLNILHLYPNEMNIYGDRGNILTLLKRTEWHGYEPKLLHYHPADIFPKEVHMIVGGGGQDTGQLKVQNDLLTIGDTLHGLANKKVPMLMICGMYQLFGKFFKTKDGNTIQGIGIFDMETYGESQRLVGNVVVSTPYGELIGYENHSGKSFLTDPSTALGVVRQGGGNNGQDGTEGAVYNEVIGSYMHGSLLPKNPKLADALIEKAATYAFGSFHAQPIDDTLAERARLSAKKRPR